MKILNYYKLNGEFFCSFDLYRDFDVVSEDEIIVQGNSIYFLNKLDPLHSRRSFLLTHPSLLFIQAEGLNLLHMDNKDYKDLLPQWLMDKISSNKVVSVNTNYPNWMDSILTPIKKKWRVNLIALGDVGSTLLIGLRLLGGEFISEIGIYDRNLNRLKRWEYELNQIRRPFDESAFPKVVPIDEEDLFNCDMFVFCASKGIPPVGSDVVDVRMAQFKGNSEIIRTYAKMARHRNFKGIFAVVSDPVDLLCKVAFLESNKDSNGEFDFKGLSSDRIIGYGLGVMNGRACFYAEQSPDYIHYLKEGRVFGPHGEGLIVADSIINYNESISDYLTDRTVNANKEVRGFGFKPYVAPSLSSGALSLIATIKGDYFYGSTYMGSAYMGSKCRLYNNHIEVEQLVIPDALDIKLKETYDKLVSII